MLESEERFQLILRSTLSSLRVISRRKGVPELKIIADSIYKYTAPKPERKVRKIIYFILGLLIVVSVVVLFEDVLVDGLGWSTDETKEEVKKLKNSFLQAESAIKILQNLKN